MLSMRGCAVVCLLVLVVTPFSFAATPVKVYDNTSTPVKSVPITGEEDEFFFAPDGFFPFCFYDTNETIGEEISLLEGAEREIVQVDVILSSIGPVTLNNLTFTLGKWLEGSYEHSGWYLTPDLIYQTQTVPNITINGPTLVSFKVPHIIVEDKISWFLHTDYEEENVGLALYDPPTIGGSYDDFWDYSPADDNWYCLYFGGNPVANFGATVWAVPEPATLSLLLLGSSMIFRRKRQGGLD